MAQLAPPAPPPDSTTLRVVMLAQVNAHAANVLPASIASVTIAALLAPLLSEHTSAARLLAWGLLLGAVIALRQVLARQRERSLPDAGSAPVWLRRYRATALLHGLTWGAVAALPLELHSGATQTLLLLVLGGMAAGAMTMTLFDLVAALLFALPALLPLVLRLAAGGAPLSAASAVAGLMIVMLLVMFSIAALRIRREQLALAAARAAEAEGAAGARRAEQLLNTIFVHIGEGISIFDREQRLVAWNARYPECIGIDPAWLHEGATLRECLRELSRAGEFGAVDDVEADIERRAQLLLSPRPGLMERRRPNGRHIEVHCSPVPGGGLIVVCTDVSERHASEAALLEQQRMLALLFENTEEGFWFIDNEQRTTDANPAMCRMLGRTREQMLGRTIYEFVDATNEAVFHHGAAERAAGRAGSYEIALTHADGTQVHCYNNATPIFDAAGHKVGAVGLFSNISEQKRAEAQIRQAGELLAQKSHVLEVTLQSLSQGVLSLDTEGRSNAWNRRFLELLEIPEELMLTRPSLYELAQYQMQRLGFGEHLAQLDEPGRAGLSRFLAGDLKSVAARYQRRRADGVVIDIETHFGADGSLVRTYTDVSASVNAQKLLSESETRFRSMADAAPALIWRSDAEGRPVWFNQRWLNLTGRTMAAELQLQWSARMHPDDYVRGEAAFTQALDARIAYDIEIRVQHADGHWGWIADTGIPNFNADGSFDGFISYGWDISERKVAEAEMIAARDEAERANRAKSEFLSRMSHELRTPLNAILGFGQLMAADAREPLGAAQRTRVQELMRGGHHLLSLINEVLDLARIEAGTLQLKLEPVELGALVADCLRLVQPMAQERHIQLSPPEVCHDAGHVLADPTRLRQVLLNLLSNAIKYNHEGGQVELSCRAHSQHSQHGTQAELLRLEVKDTGPGISAAQQARLFQAFERLDAARSGVEGTGIGLALSKWLVDLMHGEIGVDSENGRGSSFWVQLARSEAAAAPVPAITSRAGADTAPAALGASASASASPSPSPSPSSSASPSATARTSARHTVLYIEDNPVNQILMEGMLAQRPQIRLLVAGLPGTGLAMAAQARPDLVLLDIQLPGMDGFEVLRRLRQQAATRDTPVVAVSANAMQSDIDDAQRAGFDDYVTKPLDMQRLLAVVDRTLAG